MNVALKDLVIRRLKIAVGVVTHLLARVLARPRKPRGPKGSPEFGWHEAKVLVVR